MAQMRWSGAVALGLVVLVGSACRKSNEPAAGGATPGTPAIVATVAGQSISRADLDKRLKEDRAAAGQLADIENRRFDLIEGVLEEMINGQLFEREAKARQQTVPQLLAAEVDAKAAPVTEAEKLTQYEAIKDRVKGQPRDAILRDIGARLLDQRRAERREAFANELWAKAGVAVALEPPRVSVEASGPAEGPANAPVTIVEFSDFQCPYCSRAAATLKRVRQLYGDRVRLVFRHFPLRQIHPRASQAAEAAVCAGGQGRFWEMHDRLFEKQTQLETADLKRHAADLGLDTAAFNRCLDSGQSAAAVQNDVNAGEALGVHGTPAFFINGRMLSGALPLERFARVIERELAHPAAAAAAH